MSLNAKSQIKPVHNRVICLFILLSLALKQEKAGHDAQDGMDVCLCRFDRENSRVVFAGAKRPLFMVKNSNSNASRAPKEVIEIKGERKSIGGRQKEEKRTFTSQEIHMQKGDMIYLTSGGFVDQANLRVRNTGQNA